MFSLLATLALPILFSGSSASPLFPSTEFSTYSGGLLARATGCPIGPASCQNTTAQPDSCCFEHPGGQFLQTQAEPVSFGTRRHQGDLWTVGPFTDFGPTSDGTYDQFCDSSREYASAITVLKNNGRQDLLDYMNTYWLDNSGDNESFWEHEWNKHGTCMSTLRKSCVPSGSTTGLDATLYFDATVKLFKSLDTYDFLAAAGIRPSTTVKYTLSQLTSAARSTWGFTPAFDCTSGVLKAVSYYYNLKGSAIDGVWVPINAPKSGTCPASNIQYPPKAGTPTSTSSAQTGTATTTATSVPTSVPTKSTITVLRSTGTTTGCLLSYGTWSTQTCATLTAATSGSGFTLTSSRGKCAVTTSGLTCASSISTATVFTATTSGGKTLLAYNGSTEFTADSIPSGTTQVTLYSGSARSQDVVLVINAA